MLFIEFLQHPLPALCAEIHVATHLTLLSFEYFSNRLWILYRLSALYAKTRVAAPLRSHGALCNIAHSAIFLLYVCWQRDFTGIFMFFLRYYDTLCNIGQSDSFCHCTRAGSETLLEFSLSMFLKRAAASLQRPWSVCSELAAPILFIFVLQRLCSVLQRVCSPVLLFLCFKLELNDFSCIHS